MSSSLDLLQYLVWADKTIADLLEKVKPDDIDQSFSNPSGTIMEKLRHLTEEYIAWLYDLKSLSWKDEIEKVKSMNSSQLFAQMRKSLDQWIDYVRTPPKEEFLIDEGDYKVPIGLNEVVFNLVNHASYHRGQIVLFLRILGYEVGVTDYYWYRINQLNLD